MLIYKATNKIDGKIYVGQTMRNLKARLKQYVSLVGQKSKRNKFVNALRKYGFDNFTFEIIDTGENIDELNKKEIMWIEFYQSISPNLGYNVDIGGHNALKSIFCKNKIKSALKGRHLSEQHRKKISISMSGKKHPFYGHQGGGVICKKCGVIHNFTMAGKHLKPEAVEKVAAAHRGKKHTPEHRKNISDSKKGIRATPEHRKALSIARTGEKNPLFGHSRSNTVPCKKCGKIHYCKGRYPKLKNDA